MSLLLLLRPQQGGTPPPIQGVGTPSPGLRVLGAAQVGSTLSLDTSTLTPGTWTTYQWIRATPPVGTQAPSWSVIPGANGATYTLVQADAGKMIAAVLQ